jgi:hypothetical protein
LWSDCTSRPPALIVYFHRDWVRIIRGLVVQYSQQELLDASTAGVRFTRRFRSEGEWELVGRVSARRIP